MNLEVSCDQKVRRTVQRWKVKITYAEPMKLPASYCLHHVKH